MERWPQEWNLLMGLSAAALRLRRMPALESLKGRRKHHNGNRSVTRLHRYDMQSHILDVVAILAAGLMTGNELTVAVFLHPTLTRLPDAVHAPAARAFARLFGRVMPFWYALVLVLSGIETWSHWPPTSAGSRLLLAASILWLFTIVFTV